MSAGAANASLALVAIASTHLGVLGDGGASSAGIIGPAGMGPAAVLKLLSSGAYRSEVCSARPSEATCGGSATGGVAGSFLPRPSSAVVPGRYSAEEEEEEQSGGAVFPRKEGAFGAAAMLIEANTVVGVMMSGGISTESLNPFAARLGDPFGPPPPGPETVVSAVSLSFFSVSDSSNISVCGRGGDGGGAEGASVLSISRNTIVGARFVHSLRTVSFGADPALFLVSGTASSQPYPLAALRIDENVAADVVGPASRALALTVGRLEVVATGGTDMPTSPNNNSTSTNTSANWHSMALFSASRNAVVGAAGPFHATAAVKFGAYAAACGLGARALFARNTAKFFTSNAIRALSVTVGGAAVDTTSGYTPQSVLTVANGASFDVIGSSVSDLQPPAASLIASHSPAEPMASFAANLRVVGASGVSIWNGSRLSVDGSAAWLFCSDGPEEAAKGDGETTPIVAEVGGGKGSSSGAGLVGSSLGNPSHFLECLREAQPHRCDCRHRRRRVDLRSVAPFRLKQRPFRRGRRGGDGDDWCLGRWELILSPIYAARPRVGTAARSHRPQLRQVGTSDRWCSSATAAPTQTTPMPTADGESAYWEPSAPFWGATECCVHAVAAAAAEAGFTQEVLASPVATIDATPREAFAAGRFWEARAVWVLTAEALLAAAAEEADDGTGQPVVDGSPPQGPLGWYGTTLRWGLLVPAPADSTVVGGGLPLFSPLRDRLRFSLPSATAAALNGQSGARRLLFASRSRAGLLVAAAVSVGLAPGPQQQQNGDGNGLALSEGSLLAINSNEARHAAVAYGAEAASLSVAAGSVSIRCGGGEGNAGAAPSQFSGVSLSGNAVANAAVVGPWLTSTSRQLVSFAASAVISGNLSVVVESPHNSLLSSSDGFPQQLCAFALDDNAAGAIAIAPDATLIGLTFKNEQWFGVATLAVGGRLTVSQKNERTEDVEANEGEGGCSAVLGGVRSCLPFAPFALPSIGGDGSGALFSAARNSVDRFYFDHRLGSDGRLVVVTAHVSAGALFVNGSGAALAVANNTLSGIASGAHLRPLGVTAASLRSAGTAIAANGGRLYASGNSADGLWGHGAAMLASDVMPHFFMHQVWAIAAELMAGTDWASATPAGGGTEVAFGSDGRRSAFILSGNAVRCAYTSAKGGTFVGFNLITNPSTPPPQGSDGDTSIRVSGGAALEAHNNIADSFGFGDGSVTFANGTRLPEAGKPGSLFSFSFMPTNTEAVSVAFGGNSRLVDCDGPRSSLRLTHSAARGPSGSIVGIKLAAAVSLRDGALLAIEGSTATVSDRRPLRPSLHVLPVGPLLASRGEGNCAKSPPLAAPAMSVIATIVTLTSANDLANHLDISGSAMLSIRGNTAHGFAAASANGVTVSYAADGGGASIDGVGSALRIDHNVVGCATASLVAAVAATESVRVSVSGGAAFSISGNAVAHVEGSQPLVVIIQHVTTPSSSPSRNMGAWVRVHGLNSRFAMDNNSAVGTYITAREFSRRSQGDGSRGKAVKSGDMYSMLTVVTLEFRGGGAPLLIENGGVVSLSFNTAASCEGLLHVAGILFAPSSIALNASASLLLVGNTAVNCAFSPFSMLRATRSPAVAVLAAPPNAGRQQHEHGGPMLLVAHDSTVRLSGNVLVNATADPPDADDVSYWAFLCRTVDPDASSDEWPGRDLWANGSARAGAQLPSLSPFADGIDGPCACPAVNEGHSYSTGAPSVLQAAAPSNSFVALIEMDGASFPPIEDTGNPSDANADTRQSAAIVIAEGSSIVFEGNIVSGVDFLPAHAFDRAEESEGEEAGGTTTAVPTAPNGQGGEEKAIGNSDLILSLDMPVGLTVAAMRVFGRGGGVRAISPMLVRYPETLGQLLLWNGGENSSYSVTIEAEDGNSSSTLAFATSSIFVLGMGSEIAIVGNALNTAFTTAGLPYPLPAAPVGEGKPLPPHREADARAALSADTLRVVPVVSLANLPDLPRYRFGIRRNIRPMVTLAAIVAGSGKFPATADASNSDVGGGSDVDCNGLVLVESGGSLNGGGSRKISGGAVLNISSNTYVSAFAAGAWDSTHRRLLLATVEELLAHVTERPLHTPAAARRQAEVEAAAAIFDRSGRVRNVSAAKPGGGIVSLFAHTYLVTMARSAAAPLLPTDGEIGTNRSRPSIVVHGNAVRAALTAANAHGAFKHCAATLSPSPSAFFDAAAPTMAALRRAAACAEAANASLHIGASGAEATGGAVRSSASVAADRCVSMTYAEGLRFPPALLIIESLSVLSAPNDGAKANAASATADSSEEASNSTSTAEASLTISDNRLLTSLFVTVDGATAGGSSSSQTVCAVSSAYRDAISRFVLPSAGDGEFVLALPTRCSFAAIGSAHIRVADAHPLAPQGVTMTRRDAMEGIALTGNNVTSQTVVGLADPSAYNPSAAAEATLLHSLNCSVAAMLKVLSSKAGAEEEGRDGCLAAAAADVAAFGFRRSPLPLAALYVASLRTDVDKSVLNKTTVRNGKGSLSEDAAASAVLRFAANNIAVEPTLTARGPLAWAAAPHRSALPIGSPLRHGALAAADACRMASIDCGANCAGGASSPSLVCPTRNNTNTERHVGRWALLSIGSITVQPVLPNGSVAIGYNGAADERSWTAFVLMATAAAQAVQLPTAAPTVLI